MQTATARAGALRRARAWAKHPEIRSSAAVWLMSLLRVRRFFFLVKGGFEAFFRVVPLSSYSNPKFAGCGDNKRPCGRAQKQTIEPWALILAVFG